MKIHIIVVLSQLLKGLYLVVHDKSNRYLAKCLFFLFVYVVKTVYVNASLV